MTTIVRQKMSYEEFLNYEDETDHLYELENGELIQMPSESQLHQRITMLLVTYFYRMGISSTRLQVRTEIAIPGTRVNVRLPDLLVLSKELAEVTKNDTRSLITLDMPAPDLVVEVVSPNQAKRDYEDKRSEYCNRGIPEYWIVDPVLQKVTVLELKDGVYTDKVFVGDQPIVSLLLGKLGLTAAQLLKGGEE